MFPCPLIDGFYQQLIHWDDIPWLCYLQEQQPLIGTCLLLSMALEIAKQKTRNKLGVDWEKKENLNNKLKIITVLNIWINNMIIYRL